MSDTLLFPLTDVLAHAEHAWISPEHKPTFMEHMEEIEPTASLWFVKDAGAYVMSNGTGPERPKVVYAAVEGTELVLNGEISYQDQPELWQVVWDTTRDICGGDDYAENLPTDFINPTKIGQLMTMGYKYLAITLDGEEMGLEYRK
jgi:hypothetical protein